MQQYKHRRGARIDGNPPSAYAAASTTLVASCPGALSVPAARS